MVPSLPGVGRLGSTTGLGLGGGRSGLGAGGPVSGSGGAVRVSSWLSVAGAEGRSLTLQLRERHSR